MVAVGFFEILVIAVVTLLVVGPERMPEAVRNVALTVGRIKRALQKTRAEIEEHIGADEIRQQLHNEEIMANSTDLTHEKAAKTIAADSNQSYTTTTRSSS